MKQRTRAQRSIGGFTLIELLVVIIIIGVLFAIAAPGWDTILSRQRVSAAREQVVQTIRTAQSEARRTRAPRIVVFDPSTNGKPRVATAPYVAGTTLPVDNTTITNWVLLNNGDANANTVKLAINGVSSANKAIVFDGNGAIAQSPTVPAAQTPPFTITVSRGNLTTTSRATERCVVIETILGSLHTEEGPLSGTKGCPP